MLPATLSPPIGRGLVSNATVTGAILMFFMLVFASVGLGLGHAGRNLEAGNRVTVQIMQAEPEAREREARAALALLQRHPAVGEARRIDNAEMERLLEPWLGEASLGGDLPIPAMIEADLKGGSSTLERDVKAAAPSARVDDRAQWLAPLRRLIDSLRWLALLMVLLTAAAISAAIILAARAALDTHRGTIEILHLMGATDRQVARLFQRRIARDALIGAAVGTLGALLVLWLIGDRVSALGSELVGSVALPPISWAVLALLPIAGIALSMLVARVAILRALNELR